MKDSNIVALTGHGPKDTKSPFVKVFLRLSFKNPKKHPLVVDVGAHLEHYIKDYSASYDSIGKIEGFQNRVTGHMKMLLVEMKVKMGTIEQIDLYTDLNGPAWIWDDKIGAAFERKQEEVFRVPIFEEGVVVPKAKPSNYTVQATG